MHFCFQVGSWNRTFGLFLGCYGIPAVTGGDHTTLRHPERGRQPRCILAPFPFHPSVAEPKALPVLSCSQASCGCSLRATGGDERLWQGDSLQLETPPAFTTAHEPGEP